MGDSGCVKRVIIVNDVEIARQIGLATVGEEILPLQYVETLISVNPTDDPPFLNSFSAEYTWGRVLARLGLEKSEVRFTYRTRNGGPSTAVSEGKVVTARTERVVEEVGIELSFSQRQYILSLIL